MAKTKTTKHKYHRPEEEEEAMRQMEEERRKKTEEAEESSEEEGQAGDAAPPPKKKKRDKKTVKTMTKEERQKYSEELKKERKAKALQRKKEKEEKEQEKAWLKREVHKAVLKKAKGLSSRTEATSTVVRAEDLPSPIETLPEPSTSKQTDPLETSLVESGPELLSLDPFEEEEEMIRPTSTGAARVISQTISVESSITKPQKIIGGKGQKSAGATSAGPVSAGLKPAEGRIPRPTVGGKEPRSAVPKPAGGRPPRPTIGGKEPRTAVPKPAGGRPPRPTVGGKMPRNQVVPQKRESRPGSGSLNYVPTHREYLEARVAGDTLPAANKTTRRYRPGCLALQEI